MKQGVVVVFRVKNQSIEQTLTVELPYHLPLQMIHRECKRAVVKFFKGSVVQSDIYIIGVKPEKELTNDFNMQDLIDEEEASGTTEFTIHVEMKTRWKGHFCSMLKTMERLGNVGSSRDVAIMSDGDGDFQPKFRFSESFAEKDPVSTEPYILFDAG